jgi:hypothetical protein
MENEMKSVIAGLLLAAPLMANAYSIAPDVLDFNPNPLISSGGAYHYSHNLTDNAGYNPLDAITNFQLELNSPMRAPIYWISLTLIMEPPLICGLPMAVRSFTTGRTPV